MKDLNKKIIDLYEKLNANESNETETRIKLIDVILYEYLNWGHDDISFEERVDDDGSTKYADYIIRTADVSILIEAKRVGYKFKLNNLSKVTRLTGTLMEGDTGKAIKQARDYCRSKSIPFAVVTNGHQWIIFPAVRIDGIDFSKSHAIIFNSIEQILGEESFEFTSLLSRDGVIESNLQIKLTGTKNDQLEERRLNKFITTGHHQKVNPIYPLIEHAIASSFSDSIISSDNDILEKCYVKNAERMKYDEKIRMHLAKKDHLFSSSPKKPMRKKESKALADSIGTAIENKRPLAILILGSVGTGKTTFLHFTRSITASNYFTKTSDKPYPHWIEVDFRNFSKHENPNDFIYEQVFNYIKDDDFFMDRKKSLMPAYNKEISALKRGPLSFIEGNESELNSKITEMILNDYNKVKPYTDKLIKNASKHSGIFLVIDNVDQFEDDALQSSIFSDSISVASKLGINLVIAMRESTYINHKSSPTFDAFDFDYMHIEPPEIPSVLSKRFFLARSLLKNKTGDFIALNGASVHVEDLSIFIDLVKSSVIGTDVGEKINVLSCNDVRLALKMTRSFLAAGYTDPAKAIRSYNSDKKYTLPKHEAFRSILLGNESVYSESYSVLGNPFDSRIEKSSGELLRLFIISALVKNNDLSKSNFISGVDIRDHLKSIGFSEDDTLSILGDLCRFRFIHTKSHGKAQICSSYYASRLGGHITRNLISDFTFIECMMMDTFISNKKSWDCIFDLSSKILNERDVVKRLALRVDRAKQFYSSLKNSYIPLLEEAKKRCFEPIWLSNPLHEMEKSFLENLQRAQNSAQRYYNK